MFGTGIRCSDEGTAEPPRPVAQTWVEVSKLRARAVTLDHTRSRSREKSVDNAIQNGLSLDPKHIISYIYI
jgi:hypothetical protein